MKSVSTQANHQPKLRQPQPERIIEGQWVEVKRPTDSQQGISIRWIAILLSIAYVSGFATMFAIAAPYIFKP